MKHHGWREPVPTRLIEISGPDRPSRLARRVAHLTQQFSVLIIAIREPFLTLRNRLTQAGSDPARLFFLDTITDSLQRHAVDGERESFLHNPALLEAVALRAGRIVKEKIRGPAVVVVDDLASLHAHSPAREVEVWLHGEPLQARTDTVVDLIVDGVQAWTNLANRFGAAVPVLDDGSLPGPNQRPVDRPGP